MDVEPDALAVYLKCYTHLFIKDGREGEVVPTFYISKATDLDSALDPIPILHRHTPQSTTRPGHTTTHGETLS
jgi:hypothetical protein